MNIYEIIKLRKSIRKYKPEAVPDAKLDRILEATRGAPSGKNGQPWRFIVVRNKTLKEKLVPACRNQSYVAEAPVVIVGCAVEEESYQKQGGYMKSWPLDLAIAFTHLILAATAEGLATCWIGAFDESEVKKALDIPDKFRVVGLTPLGYPAENPPHKNRKQISEIVSYDKAPAK
ncbi:MAG: nitroreductase family protein [Planctomycetes bacterium]|nr:nitroreductase family protein [Planctomycetota bacterium]